MKRNLLLMSLLHLHNIYTQRIKSVVIGGCLHTHYICTYVILMYITQMNHTQLQSSNDNNIQSRQIYTILIIIQHDNNFKQLPG